MVSPRTETGAQFSAEEQKGSRQKPERRSPTSESQGHAPSLAKFPKRDEAQVYEGEGNQELPREAHELVHAQTRERGTYPDEADEEPKEFHAEPNVGRDKL